MRPTSNPIFPISREASDHGELSRTFRQALNQWMASCI